MNYTIIGGNKLYGHLPVYSAKNCLLVLLAASVLTEDTMVFLNCKRISDVDIMTDILQKMGGKVKWIGENLEINCSGLNKTEIPEDLSQKMRGSIFLLGALLGKCKKATAFTPGGCAIGKRPIDIHTKGLTDLGVKIVEQQNKIICDGENAKGSEIFFRFASVGATENLLMCAVLTKGTTILHNCAIEPEVVALCQCLVKMGAKISGIGQSTIVVEGVKKLNGVQFKPIPDRIVTGTYLLATAIAGGDTFVTNCQPKHISALLKVLKTAGSELSIYSDAIRIRQVKPLLAFNKVETDIYPKFATDMQSLVLTAATVAKGNSTIVEKVFENRLLNNTVELRKMGAKIDLYQNTAKVSGVKKLTGANVRCSDLRGGAGLVLAGLVAEGVTKVYDIHHIERGYFDLPTSLNNVGADIVIES